MESQTAPDTSEIEFGHKIGQDEREIEHVEQAAALDNDPESDTSDWHTRDDKPGPTISRHLAPDNDPYGWIAGVEAAHPTFIASPEPLPVRPETEHVLVWQHAMIEPHRFDHATAQVLPNGTLLVTRPGSQVPLKGYAPGVWVTFEHIGEQYHTKPQAIDPQLERDRARAASRPGRIQMTNHLTQVSAATGDKLLHEVAEIQAMIDPMRRTPPTFEQDADDTATIPKIESDDADGGEGGGVGGPKAPAVRKDGARTGRTPRPGSDPVAGDDEERKPGFWRSLWQSLRDPEWDPS